VKSGTSVSSYNSAPVSKILWSLRARSLVKARKAFLRGEPEGLHDLRVALRRVEATAAALGSLEHGLGRLARKNGDDATLRLELLPFLERSA
jgi:hypothetical protein